MRLLVVIFLFINGLLFSQKYVYHTKTYKYRNEITKSPKWEKLPDKNTLVILNVDTVQIDSQIVTKRILSIYSTFYQEYNLINLNTYNRDDKGNYSIDFIGEDIWGNECDISYTSLKNKLILIIHYPSFSIKYTLKKRITTSYYYTQQINTTYD